MPARITIIEQIVYQADGESPFDVTVNQGYEIRVESEEEPYSRTYRLKPGEDPVDLDSGWVKSPGMLYIKNRGAATIVLFSPSHRQEIPPYCASRVYPVDFSLKLLIPPSSEPAEDVIKVAVTVFPK